jgi:outer membrane protein OmpA-like peptidoglycan-associated protein
MPPVVEEAVSPDLEPPPPPELEEDVGELEIESPPSDNVLENIEDQYPEAVETEQPAQNTDSQTEEVAKTVTESSCDDKVASLLANNKITFERGSTRIQSDSHAVLNDIVRAIKKCPDVVIYIHGHTDNTGDYQSNRLISLNRAKSVGRYIISKGVLQEIRVVGHGPDQPVASNDTAEGRAANRRIEFKFTPTKTSE